MYRFRFTARIARISRQFSQDKFRASFNFLPAKTLFFIVTHDKPNNKITSAHGLVFLRSQGEA